MRCQIKVRPYHTAVAAQTRRSELLSTQAVDAFPRVTAHHNHPKGLPLRSEHSKIA